MSEITNEIVRAFLNKNFPTSDDVIKKWELFRSSQCNVGVDWEIASIFKGTSWSCDKKTFDFYLKNGWNISQVRRVSDQSIWTVGDEAFIGGENRKITEFFISNTTNPPSLYFKTPVNHSWSFESIRKPDKPVHQSLFVTNDGIVIHKGDSYWFIYPQWTIAECLNAHGVMNGSIGTFSTEEKAKDYVRDNKPFFSLKEILNVIKFIGDGAKGSDARWYLNDQFIELAKSKINP